MKGVVWIHYNVTKPGDDSHAGLVGMKQFVDFAACLPIRISAFHLCTEGNEATGSVIWSFHDAFIRYYVDSLPKYTQQRSCVHHGSAIELKEHLCTYCGIPQDVFPVNADGIPRASIRNVWLYGHLGREMAALDHDDLMSTDSSSDDEDLVPYANQDVLLGKGFVIQNHPGNIAFREFLGEHKDRYESARGRSKCGVAKDLVSTLQANGVRFWQKGDEDSWAETSFDNVVKTVAQFFRSARKRRS